jgi:hypothetical protein
MDLFYRCQGGAIAFAALIVWKAIIGIQSTLDIVQNLLLWCVSVVYKLLI